MRIDFYGVYIATSPAKEYALVLVGVRPIGKDHAKGMLGLPAGSMNPLLMFGPVIDDTPNYVSVASGWERGSDGEPVVWTLRPVTRTGLASMKTGVDNQDELLKHLKTDELLQIYYQTIFLPDYWETAYLGGVEYEYLYEDYKDLLATAAT